MSGAQVTIISDGGSPVDSSTPTFHGVITNPGGVVSGVVVSVYVGATLDGTTISDGSGNWSYTIQTPLLGSSDSPVSYNFKVYAALQVPSLALSVSVAKIASAPSDVRIDIDWIETGSTAGTQWGKFFSVDSDVGDTFTYTLTDDAGGRFAISSGVLVAGATATNYATTRSHNITVRSTDSHGLHFDKTMTIRVFPVLDFSTAPSALDPSTLSGVVVDINPISGKITKDGSNNISALVSSDAGAYNFTQASGASKPVWVATSGPNNQPAMTWTAAKHLDCTDSTLVHAFDANWPTLTVIIIAEHSTLTSPQRYITWYGAAAGGSNGQGFRHQAALLTGGYSLSVGDVNNAFPSASSNPNQLSLNTPHCLIGMIASSESAGSEYNGDWATKSGMSARKLTFAATTSLGPVSIGTSGGTFGPIGKIYRIVYVDHPLGWVDRWRIAKWAHDTYGTAAPPAWGMQINPDSDYTLRYTEHFDYLGLNGQGTGNDIVFSTSRTERPVGGVGSGITPYPGASLSNAYGGHTNLTAETAFGLDMSTPALQQYDTMRFRNSRCVFEGKDTPAPLKGGPLILPGALFDCRLITAYMETRYGGHQAVYGYWEFKGVYPHNAGPGWWPAYWLYRQCAGTTEIDLPDGPFGQDPFGYHAGMIGSDIPGGFSIVYYPIDDVTHGEHYFGFERTPTTMNFYYDRRLFCTASITGSHHQPMYWLIDMAAGENAGAFSGAIDLTGAGNIGTTTRPVQLVTDYVKFWQKPDPVSVDDLTTPAEATTLIAAMTATGAAPDATHAGAIRKLINKAKSITFDGYGYTSQSLWAIKNFIFIPAAQTAAHALLEWKSGGTIVATNVGSVPFTADRGWKNTAVGKYIDTGINLATAGLPMAPTQCHWNVFTLDQPAGTADMYAMGTTKWRVAPSLVDTYYMGGTGTNYRVYQGAQAAGNHTMVRGGPAAYAFFNGALTGVGNDSSAGTVFDSETVKLCASGSTVYGSQRLAVATCGQHSHEAVERVWDTLVREYLHTLGAV